MSKSVVEIANICEKKIEMVILQELPEPNCPIKKEQNRWKVNEVKRELAIRLGGLGITISVQ
jgi:hypothetical protein